MMAGSSNPAPPPLSKDHQNSKKKFAALHFLALGYARCLCAIFSMMNLLWKKKVWYLLPLTPVLTRGEGIYSFMFLVCPLGLPDPTNLIRNADHNGRGVAREELWHKVPPPPSPQP